jgi:hypothetical protein
MMKTDAICIFIGPSISIFISGEALFSAPSQLTYENNINIFICIIVCSDTINKHEMSLILNFLTEISVRGIPKRYPK